MMLEPPSGVVGLDQAAVRARVQAGHVNTAPPMPGRTVAEILRANVLTRFNAILGVMFVIVLVVGPVQDALFGIVLVVNAGFGVVQELRAKRELDRLAIMTAAKARVIRDGAAAEIPVDQVVLDDVLELRQGDQVPVDGTVLRTDGMETDEALLTGEAEPVAKQPGEQMLSGSFVVAGTGYVRATGVGGGAYAARLQVQARRFSLIRSELQQGTNQILRLVTWVMIPAGLLVVLSEFLRSHDPLRDAARGSAAALVAMVPEGLVLLTSLAFTAGALRLARRRVLVQELAAVEGLARVDVLCIDKTGTLTKPGMRVSETRVLGPWPPALIAEVLGAMAAADDAPNGTIRALAARYGAPLGWTVQARTPFSSARKWSGISFAGHGTWVLGAPSVVADDAAGRPEGLAAAIAGHETTGHRVLLLAGTAGPLDGDRLPADTEPAALVVLAEELRGDAAATVQYLLGQGVEIKVLSGDAPRAVAVIARRAGIPVHGDPCDASGLSEDDDTGLAAALAAANVFGRVRPGHKLAAVRALQAAGHVVAMVGDGVNDVQALKQADLGIAMGSGSQAGRSVARVVLLDSSFAAIPRMLEEGRRVIANIERVAGLFVTKTVYAAIIAVAVGVAGVTYPFYPRHLTIISTLTIGIPGFFLALAPGAPLARPGFTRRVLTFTIPAGIAAAAAGLAAYAIARIADVSITAARTAALLAVFTVGLWVLALVAGRPVARGAALVATMGGALVVLFAVPLARQVLALQLPPASVCVQVACAVLAAIGGLTLWRRVGGVRPHALPVRPAPFGHQVRTALTAGPSGPGFSSGPGSRLGSMAKRFIRRTRVWLGRRTALLLLAVTVSGLAAGGLARLAGAGAAGNAAWLATAACGLGYAFWAAADSILRGRVGVDVIALLALAGAVAVRELLAAAVISVMLTSGRTLEAWAAERARHDLNALLDRAPRTARRYRGDALETVPLDEIAIGDVLLVAPGEILPVDGTVTAGVAILDESAITGEAWPAEHGPGEAARSGTLNAGGPFDLRAETNAADSTYAGIVRLVSEAERSQAPFVRLSDRYAMWFLPLTLAVSAVAWAAGGAARAVAVLVVATPCPLILAAPVALVSGLSAAARRGVVVKSGAVLERLARCSTLVLDKTGTLTAGQPTVTGVVPADSLPPEELLNLAACLDQVSGHVLAAAIVRAAREQGGPLVLPAAVTEVPGQGIAGTVSGRPVRLGRAGWAGVAGDPGWVRTVRRRARLDGALTVFVAADGKPAGALLLEDRIRPDARQTIRAIRRGGVTRIVLATGDQAEAAGAVGALTGVDEILAGLTPAGKLDVVRREQRRAPVIMAGDGINDAPALALADVGIAMGARGSTASSEAADAVLTVDHLGRLGDVAELARRTRRIALQSVLAGMGMSLAAMGLAAAGLLPAVWGALLQEAIDVAVILNALRALRPPAPAVRMTAAHTALTSRFRTEHQTIRADIEQLRATADTLEAPGAMTRVRQAYDMLTREVWPHENAEEAELYPSLNRLLGGTDPTAPMSRAHAEIAYQITRLGRLVDDIGTRAPDQDDLTDLRSILYGLYAILRLHTVQEDETYLSLADSADALPG